MRLPAHAGRTLIDVRRLAAVDMYGRHGSKRRRRLILAEFLLAAIDIPMLGLATLLAASSAPWVLFGGYLIGIGLNYAPLALHAISLSRSAKLDAELARMEVGEELRRYAAKQLLIAVPLLVLILGAAQSAAGPPARSESREATSAPTETAPK